MKRAKKLMAVALVCFMMTSFGAINVSAIAETTGDVKVSAMSYCTQHSIAEKFLTSYISGIVTHKYQPSANVPPVNCTVTTTVSVYAQYCTKCGTSFGNVYYHWDSHSAH